MVREGTQHTQQWKRSGGEQGTQITPAMEREGGEEPAGTRISQQCSSAGARKRRASGAHSSAAVARDWRGNVSRADR